MCILVVSSLSCTTDEPTFNGTECLVYSVLSETDKTAKLAGIASVYYSGKIIISSSAIVNGSKYKVIKIGDYAMRNALYLTSVEMPNTITSIGESAFAYCDSLKSISLPDSLTTIGNEAFKSCNLSTIELPKNIKTLGGRAFSYNELSKITVKAITPPSASGGPFDNFSVPLYVPASSISLYKADSYWKKFTNIYGI